MIGDQVVLVNRTPNTLSFVANGRHYPLKPGKNYGFLEGHVKFAMSQNPLFGTEDYFTLEYESLVGVETPEGKQRTDCSEIPQSLLDELKDMERFNVASMSPAAQQGRMRIAAAWRKDKMRIPSLAGANSIGSNNE
jgi:hypothetical protein